MNFRNNFRYREKLHLGRESLMKKYYDTISYRRKQHCNTSRANIGLLVRHKMSIPKFKHKMQTSNLRSQSSKLRSLGCAETNFYEFNAFLLFARRRL